MDEEEILTAHQVGAQEGLTAVQTSKILNLFMTAKATSVADISNKTKLKPATVKKVLETLSHYNLLRGPRTHRKGLSRRWLHRPILTSFSADLMDPTAMIRQWKPKHPRVFFLTVL